MPGNEEEHQAPGWLAALRAEPASEPDNYAYAHTLVVTKVPVDLRVLGTRSPIPLETVIEKLYFSPNRHGKHFEITRAMKQNHQHLLGELGRCALENAPPAAKLGVQGALIGRGIRKDIPGIGALCARRGYRAFKRGGPAARKKKGYRCPSGGA